MIKENTIVCGDAPPKLAEIDTESVDLVYFDPPFFTQKRHVLSSRVDLEKVFSFDDKYASIDEYLGLITNTLIECKRILKNTGSVFLHCDKTASHHLRLVLDSIFGEQNFQSEIVWAYKRWSNAKKGLLNSHQIIFFYSKCENFKFKTLYNDYSPTTNLDQIQQQRERNRNGKSSYKRDSEGKIVIAKEKKGVPLSDVWEIPYLNPKAKERVGYPTQKPVALLTQILEIASEKGDLIVDPFCGSGTTCVAAKHLGRNFIGIDLSKEAVALAKERINKMTISHSNLLMKGHKDYIEKTEDELAILKQIDAFPVQRNAGIDGFLKKSGDLPVPVKIQSRNENLKESIAKLTKATGDKEYETMIVIQTKETLEEINCRPNVLIIPSLQLQVSRRMKVTSKSV